MHKSEDHLDVVRRYLRGVEDGAFSEIQALFTADLVVEQLPNRIYPNGLRATPSQMESAFAQGRKLLAKQHYEIKNTVVHGDSVSVEVLWTGDAGDWIRQPWPRSANAVPLGHVLYV